MTKEGRSKHEGVEHTPRGQRNAGNANEDHQRTMMFKGLDDIPDDELQEFLNDEEFMQGLNVVDAWDGDEENHNEPRSNRERDHRRNSRDRNRRDHRGPPANRNPRETRGKRDDRRREDARRDPTKSSKDIERDKVRTRRDNDSKVLAEKEKAIKNLFDSDMVVPPGTEAEAIETEKQIFDRRNHRSREHRRSSADRHRNEVHHSPVRRRSLERIRPSPRRERSPFVASPDRRRRPNWPERRGSSENRRENQDRHVRRRIGERDLRVVVHRSRSRLRSRSPDRPRRRWGSRSPVRRGGSPRRRTSSKSPDRRRKRSPFINELARQFRNEALMTGNIDQGFIQQQPLIQKSGMPPIGHQSGNQQLPQQHFIHQEVVGSTFIPFEPHPPPPQLMNFEQQMPIQQIPHADYIAPPILYNQPNSMMPDRSGFPGLLPTPSPQPVPAPHNIDQSIFVGNQQFGQPRISPTTGRGITDGHGSFSGSYNNGNHHSSSRRERQNRQKTPEPPVISDNKPFGKTSLSSLLEASVSAKDFEPSVSNPGFKPEIIRHCEQALRDLPDEDFRLRTKGRFFFQPNIEEPKPESTQFSSNSILLRRAKSRQIWSANELKSTPSRPAVEMHQKYSQTEMEYDERSTQTFIEMADFCVQVCPGDLQLSPVITREEKRPIMDRLDWNVRETFDYGTKKAREADDLRWSLSSSQKRPWSRTISPDREELNRRDLERNHRDMERPIQDEIHSRDFRVHSPVRNRDSFGIPFGSTRNDSFAPRDRFSPGFRRDSDKRNEYNDDRSDHSRDRSPIMIDDEDVQIVETENYSRDSSWRGRGEKNFTSSSNPSHKSRGNPRGKLPSGRSYRGRGASFRGKF